MTASVDSITLHAKENRSTYMINLFGSIIPILTFLIYAATKVDGLATDSEVVDLIITHNVEEMHPKAEIAVGNVQQQLDRMLSIQIEERIEKQLKIICENPQLRNALEPNIKQLIRDYNGVSPVRYVRPSCAQLGVG